MPGPYRPGRPRGRHLGQHFLTSTALAAQLVADAGIGPREHVVEFGAGTGVLTAAVVARGAWVSAVEVDLSLTTQLVRRFADDASVAVYGCSLLDFPLPSSPFRVFANPPFDHTSAILHRLLDDPGGGLVRADLVVQWQVARALAQAGERGPMNLVSASWAPWWCFRRARRLPAALFRPAPSVDAAVLAIVRRDPPLLPAGTAPAFTAFVRDHFNGSERPATAVEWVSRFRARAAL